MSVDPLLALDRSIRLLQDYVNEPAEVVGSAMTSTLVKLRADDEALSSPVGQFALLASFEAIARLGVGVILDIPAGTSFALPPGYLQTSVVEGLHARASKLITPTQAAGTPDLAITLSRIVLPTEIALGGDDTSVHLRLGESAGGWVGDLPFGGALAGAAAGAEVARAIITKLLGDRPPLSPIHLSPRPVDLGLPTMELRGALDLGEVDFVSAGAITHSTLFVLSSVPHLTLAGRVFDEDTSHGDNLNRNFLLDADGLEIPKVESLVSSLSGSGIELIPHRQRVTDVASLPGSRPLADTVCVGVDSVEARWDIQRLAPGWLGVGATSHALGMASEHWPGTPCAGCRHDTRGEPTEHFPTISFVSLLAGTLLAYRLVASKLVPQRRAEVTFVLDAFNLAGLHTLVTEPVPLNTECPVPCSVAIAA